MSNIHGHQAIASAAQQRLENLDCAIHHLSVSSNAEMILIESTRPGSAGVAPAMPFFFFHLCLSGNGQLVQDTDLFKFDARVMPGAIGLSPIAEGEVAWPDMRHISLGLTQAALNQVLRDSGLSQPEYDFLADRASDAFEDPLIATTLSALAKSRNGVLDTAFARHCAGIIVNRVFAPERFGAASRSDDTAHRLHPLSNRELNRIAGYLEDNLHRRVEVEELAALVGLSKHHFSRRFAKTMGVSPYQHVINVKMQTAGALLAAPGREPTVTEVALSVGYDNPALFALTFRKHWGISPRLWRTRNGV